MTLKSDIKAIKSLKIQGARSTASFAVNSFLKHSVKIRAKSRQDFLNKVFFIKKALSEARYPEPMLINSLNFITSDLNAESPDELKKIIAKRARKLEDTMRENLERIAIIGARSIPDKSIILTHCHSSSVTSILKQAYKNGKKFEVLCCETRPLLQGRITARELANFGIKTKMIIDSAMRVYVNEADMVLIGADAITSSGSVINKIGSGVIASLAKEARTPLFVSSSILKFDPQTISGTIEKIEHRSPNEIWDKAPKNIKILNPAFEEVPADLIKGVITELGIFPPEAIYKVFNDHYKWMV